MKIPKILVDGHILDGRPQGTTTYIAGLYKAIAELNLAKITIATFNESSLEKYNLLHPNISWVKLSSKNKYMRLIYSLPYLEYTLKPDLTHYNYIAPVLKFSKRLITCHDLLFLDFPEYFSFGYRTQKKILFYISTKTSNIVSTVSEYSAFSISKHFSIPIEQITITPNAIKSYEQVENESVDMRLSNNKYFVYVSRFEPRKNQHLLVRAFNRFCDTYGDEYKLVLVGYPDLSYPGLENELANSKKERVIILSDIDSTELMWLYKNAVASIYPSHAEGFGIPPIEAIAAGGRSYCSNNTALHELTQYVNGTFDSTNIDEIENTFHRAISEVYKDINPRLRREVLDKFNWEKSAKIFMSYL